jgi:hypothetical protein
MSGEAVLIAGSVRGRIKYQPLNLLPSPNTLLKVLWVHSLEQVKETDWPPLLDLG